MNVGARRLLKNFGRFVDLNSPQIFSIIKEHDLTG